MCRHSALRIKKGGEGAQRNAINLETCWIVNRKERTECLECARVAFCGCVAPEARRRECKQTWRGVARWRLQGALPETQRWIGTRRKKKTKGFPRHTQETLRGMWWEKCPPKTRAMWKNVTIRVRPRRQQVGGIRCSLDSDGVRQSGAGSLPTV